MENNDNTNVMFWTRLYGAVSEFPSLKKEKVNPYFKSRYIEINQILGEIKPILLKYKILILQPIATTSEKNLLKTILIDVVDGKEYELATAYLPTKDDDQKAGSSITYWRRYMLQTLFCLEADDDDANQSAGKTEAHATTVPSSYLATEKQKEFMKKIGIDPELVAGATKQQANEILTKYRDHGASVVDEVNEEYSQSKQIPF